VYILAHIHWCVVIDNMGHVFDIYPARYEIRTDEPRNVSVHLTIKQRSHPNMSIFCALNLPKTDLRSEGLRSLE
jgi:hypothetical protein